MKKQLLVLMVVLAGLVSQTSAFGGRQLIQNGTQVIDPTLNKMVPLIYGTSEGNGGYICTGTFISSNTILTAAHCVLDMSQKNLNVNYSINNIRDAKNIKIILSKDPTKPVNLNDRNGNNNFNIYTASKVYVHPEAFRGVAVIADGLDIKSYSEVNDLAIIQLASNLEKDTIEIADISKNNPAKDSEEIIIGYGVDNGPGVIINDPFNGASGVLRQALAKVESFDGNYSIINLIGTVSNGTKNGYTHICQGDSGGPDLINKNNTYIIQGVHSFGQGSECGRPNAPGSSINVAAYYNWIKYDYVNSLLQK